MQKPVKKIIAFSLLLIVIIGGGVGIHLYNKPHADISKMPPDFILDAKALFDEFDSEEANASQKYIDKVLQVHGTLVESNTNTDGSVILSLEDVFFGVSCAFDRTMVSSLATKLEQLKPGEEVTIKGQCDGMLTDVKLSHCTLVDF
jgi:hypothetical protein